MLIPIVHFNTALYTFDGFFKIHPEASFDNCPPGRPIYITGNDVSNSQMVSVYDPVSGLSGYVNPNSYHFILEPLDEENKSSAVIDSYKVPEQTSTIVVNKKYYRSIAHICFACSFCCVVFAFLKQNTIRPD
jgi:hypothetical protein